jgi:plastocyanin
MQWTLGLWTAIFVLGIGIYYYRYLVERPAAPVTASLEQFRQAGDVLLTQLAELRTAVKERNVQAAKRAAERTVNLIEGKIGTGYGDLDKSGTVEDPGNGIGLLTYLRAVTSADLEPGAASVAKETEGWLTAIRDAAGAVLAAADLGAVEATVEKATTVAERASREGITALVAAAPPVVIVIMDDFLFKPKRMTVAQGTTVVWVNQEAETHTVTADNKKFDSGDVEPGVTFGVTFKERGTIPYYCNYHGGRGGVDMAGMVVVE